MVYSTTHYSIETIKDEALKLVRKGLVSRQQPIYTLCQHIPPREWSVVEQELERCEFLLRDRICDLIPCESWDDD